MPKKSGLPDRDPAADLLRIIAVLFVIGIHFSIYTDFYKAPIDCPRMTVMLFIRSACAACVPLFLTLSGYLMTNIDAIAIVEKDACARNGGCTEPHVSHVLSARLSSRPMGWSRETLKHLVPILAAGGATFESEQEPESAYPPASQFMKAGRKHYLPNTLGLADPDHSVTFPARKNKVTPLFNALRPF